MGHTLNKHVCPIKLFLNKHVCPIKLFYSLIETAKANNLEPYAYLVAVLDKIPYADTVEKLEELLPWNIKMPVLKK